MAVQAGFVAGTLITATTNIADVINPRRLFADRLSRGACVNAALAVRADRYGHHRSPVLHGHGTRLGLSARPEDRRRMVPRAPRRRTRLRRWGAHLRVRAAASAGLAGVGTGVAQPGLTWPRSARRQARCWSDSGSPTARTSPHPHRSIRTRSAIVWRSARRRGWPRSAISDTCGSSTRCGRGSPLLRPPGWRGHAGTTAGSLIAFITIASGAIGCAAAGYWADAGERRASPGPRWSISAACALISPLFFQALARIPHRPHRRLGLHHRRRFGAVLGAGRSNTARERTSAPR